VTTALHLAHAHQAPPGPKRKRKGGGDSGGEFYEFAKRIYADDRADGDARALLLAVAYAIVTVPDDGKAQWDLVRQSLGRGRYSHRHPLSEFAVRDVPRYVPPEYRPGGYDPLLRRCQAPRVRPYKSRPVHGYTRTAAEQAAQDKRDAEDFRNVRGVCGEGNTESVLEKLPGTGWHKMHYFCPRHRDHLLQVREQVREQNKLAPAPVPNAGGLLPSYFDSDWVPFYRHFMGEEWTPPVYGIRADDWPVPGRDLVPPRARLRLAALDGELLGSD
jgi:hypothetical protein